MPWLASIHLISPTTLFVTGSMIWMLSPAEFVWMIRSFGLGAASKEKDTAHRTIPPKTARHPRNTCLFVIFVISSFERQPILNGRFPADQSVTPNYFNFAPNTHAFNVNHSESSCELKCL